MRWKGWIIGCLSLLLLPLLSGCSTLRLGYNQGPFLAHWWLDGYADFNAEQSQRVKAALEDWFTWHRATQLPEYAQALAAMQVLAVDKITAAQACTLVQAWQQRAERAYEHALPAAAEQLRTLSAEQIKRIERQQAKKQKEAEDDYLQADPAERQKAALKRAVERAETLYGSLSDGQRQQLAVDLQATQFNPDVWLAERRARQQDITRNLRQWQAERSDSGTVQAGLRQLAVATVQSPRRDYQAYAETLMQANCTLMANVHNRSTPAQKAKAVAKLKGWEEDLRALMRQ